MSYSGPFANLSHGFLKSSKRLSPRETVLVEHQIRKSMDDFRVAGDLSLIASLAAAIGFVLFCLGMIYFFMGSHSFQMASKIGFGGLFIAGLLTAAASWKTKIATDRMEVIRKRFGKQF